jgi:hypothetical protein
VNLASARIVLRPRFRLESVDLAFRFVLGDARRTYVKFSLIVLLPAFAVSAGARWALELSWWSAWALALALGSLSFGVFTVVASRLLFEQAASTRAVLGLYRTRLPSYLAAMGLSRLLIAAAWLLIAPGAIAWARYAYVPEAVLLEHQPARQALGRSIRLSRAGNDAFGTILAGAVLSLVIIVGVEEMFLGIVRDLLSIPIDSSRLFSNGGSYAALAGYFASVPWAAAHRFLSYIDGRTRQDGWDVQLRFMALDQNEA